MKYSRDFQPEGEDKKRAARGFHIALALCLLAIVGVAVVTFLVDTPDKDIDETPTTTVTTPTVTTTAKPVAAPATGVPDTRTTTTTATTTTATVTTTAVQADLFVFPASNVILREYSDDLVFSETLNEWRTHNGVDFETKKGQEIKAAADGTVIAIQEDPLWGHVIQIDHGDKLVSRYCGVTASGVKEGQAVKAGQVIGSVSDIPAEILDDCHIHVEFIANGKYVDPMTLIRGEAVKKTTVTTTTTTSSAE